MKLQKQVDFLRDNEFDKELALEIDEYFNKNNLDKVGKLSSFTDDFHL